MSIPILSFSAEILGCGQVHSKPPDSPCFWLGDVFGILPKGHGSSKGATSRVSVARILRCTLTAENVFLARIVQMLSNVFS